MINFTEVFNIGITIKNDKFLISQESPEGMAYEDYEIILKGYAKAAKAIADYGGPKKYEGPPSKHIVTSAVACLARPNIFREADEFFYEQSTLDKTEENLRDIRYESLQGYIESNDYAGWYGVHKALSFANLCWAEDSGEYNWNGDTYYDIVNSPQVSVIGYEGENSLYVNVTGKVLKRGETSAHEQALEDMEAELWGFDTEEEYAI